MRPRAVRLLVAAVPAALFAVMAIRAGAELVLLDGRSVAGESVTRDGDVYVLTTGTGAVTMPADLVREVRLTGEPEPPSPPPPPMPPGFRAAGPENLAGPGVQPPTTAEQFAVFGKPVEWRQGPIDTTWVPTSDWNMDPNVQNNFAPTRWSKDAVDTSWAPTSAYDLNKDVMADSRSKWAKAPIDSTWVPTDGFKKSGW